MAHTNIKTRCIIFVASFNGLKALNLEEGAPLLDLTLDLTLDPTFDPTLDLSLVSPCDSLEIFVNLSVKCSSERMRTLKA